jgi:hypothetical protein
VRDPLEAFDGASKPVADFSGRFANLRAPVFWRFLELLERGEIRGHR